MAGLHLGLPRHLLPVQQLRLQAERIEATAGNGLSRLSCQVSRILIFPETRTYGQQAFHLHCLSSYARGWLGLGSELWCSATWLSRNLMEPS